MLLKCLPSNATKVTCENCGTQTKKLNLARHKKRCSVGTLYCTKSTNFSTTSQADLNYHIAKKYPRVRAKNTQKCKICLEKFSGFYALRKHSGSQHGNSIKTSNLDMDTLLEGIDDAELKEELNACNHFLVDSELEKGRHCVFNFAMSSFNNSFLNDKLDHVINQLKCAAKVNLAFGFVLKNIEDGTCRYFYAHENNTVMEMSKLVCTEDDTTNENDKLQKKDTVDHNTRERANTEWRFYKLTNVSSCFVTQRFTHGL